jgi:hypothetical protein
MDTQPTCPYCNALVPADALANSRIRCSRCGESFANSWSDAIKEGPPEIGAERWKEGIQSGLPTTESPPQRSNRSLGILIVGVMVVVALGALGFALKTWGERESRHPKTAVELQAARARVPADLPALGYLPVDCQIVAGVHLADMRKDPAGKKLLEPPLPGLLNVGLAALEKRTGFQVDDIDHAVFGIALDGIIPQLTAVVRTRRSYTLEEVARAVHGKPLRHHNLPLFRIKLEPVGGGYLWCADEFTLVLVLRPDAAKIEDMDRIPAKPRKGSAGLAEPLRGVLESLMKNDVIWLAGYIQDPAPIQTLAGLTRLPKTDTDLLTKIQSFAVGIMLEEDVTLLGSLECRDPAAAMALEKHLAKLDFPGSKSTKVIGPPPKADGPEARGVSLQIRTDPAGMRRMLEAGKVMMLGLNLRKP